MRRIRYISKFTSPMTSAAIEALARDAAEQNARQDITGMLIATGDLFFQIIEGPAASIDALYARILKDPRHQDVLLLSVEMGHPLTRMCPDWAMKKVDLSREAADEMEPLRALLEAIFDQHQVIDRMRASLEKTTWRLFLKAELDTM